jgi:hypothetical protein
LASEPETAGLMTTIGISEVEGLARAARELYAAPNETELLRLAVDLAVRIIDGSDHAGICVVQGRELSTPVAFDDVVRRCDALQYQLHEGPCLDAVRWQETVISQNLSDEARWPEWTPHAVSVLGIKAIMSLWLLQSERATVRRSCATDQASPGRARASFGYRRVAEHPVRRMARNG